MLLLWEDQAVKVPPTSRWYPGFSVLLQNKTPAGPFYEEPEKAFNVITRSKKKRILLLPQRGHVLVIH